MKFSILARSHSSLVVSHALYTVANVGLIHIPRSIQLHHSETNYVSDFLVCTIETLVTNIVRWFLALDKTLYCRLTPVNLRDIYSFTEGTPYPDVYAEFLVHCCENIKRAFSAIAIDHADTSVTQYQCVG